MLGAKALGTGRQTPGRRPGLRPPYSLHSEGLTMAAPVSSEVALVGHFILLSSKILLALI